MLVYEGKFQIINVLAPNRTIFEKTYDYLMFNYVPPKVAFEDRIIILREGEFGKLIFYDIERDKFIATCEIEGVNSICIVGEELIIGIEEESM